MPSFVWKWLGAATVLASLAGYISIQHYRIVALQATINTYKVASAQNAATVESNKQVSKEISDANDAQTTAMAGYISALLVRKPAAVPTAHPTPSSLVTTDQPEPRAIPTVDLTTEQALGQCQGELVEALGTALAGWEQVGEWREYAKRTGQAGSQ